MIDLLLNETFVRSVFPWLAAATPIAAIALFLAGMGRRRSADETGDSSADSENGGFPDGQPPKQTGASRRQCLVALALLGLAGPVIWLMWLFYEAIMNAFGFASVNGLLIVLACFAFAGLLVGVLARRYSGT
jgi:hypothetical protein